MLSSVETSDEGFQENPWTTIEPHSKQKNEGGSDEWDDLEKQEVLPIETNEKEKESKSNSKEKEKGKRQTKEKDSTSSSEKKEEDKPILLCHWHERHYGSLATDPRRDNKGNSDTKKTRPSPRMVNPRYEDYKDWTY